MGHGASRAPVIAGEEGQQPRPLPHVEPGSGGTAVICWTAEGSATCMDLGRGKPSPAWCPERSAAPLGSQRFPGPGECKRHLGGAPAPGWALRGHGCLGRDCIDTSAGCAALGGAGALPTRVLLLSGMAKGSRGASPPSLAQCPAGCHPSGSRMEKTRCRDPVTAPGGLLEVGSFGLS